MIHRNRLRSAWNRVSSGEIHRALREWQPWLSDTGSLTQKIEAAIGQKLEVQVLRDYPQSLNSDESRYFHFQLRHCRVREVLLCSNGIPLVMAHSVIPTFSSSGSNHAILRLGTKPLGAVLFSKGRKHSKAKPPRVILLAWIKAVNYGKMRQAVEWFKLAFMGTTHPLSLKRTPHFG